MVNLPDGTVLAESCTSPSQLYVYTPSGSPLPQGQPTIQSVSAGSGSCNTTCYHLTGTGLNGISEGASYGDDEQMATDFPLPEKPMITIVSPSTTSSEKPFRTCFVPNDL